MNIGDRIKLTDVILNHERQFSGMSATVTEWDGYDLIAKIDDCDYSIDLCSSEYKEIEEDPIAVAVGDHVKITNPRSGYALEHRGDIATVQRINTAYIEVEVDGREGDIVLNIGEYELVKAFKIDDVIVLDDETDHPGREAIVVASNQSTLDVVLVHGDSGVIVVFPDNVTLKTQEMIDDPLYETKDTNPKDAIGITKPPTSVLPFPVLFEVGNALFEGALKYGRHNYREAGVLASVYVDGAMRHLGAWWEGQDLDPDSELSHITKAIAGLMVLRDSMMRGNWKDDRPPKSNVEEWMAEADAKTKALLEKYPNPKKPHTQI